MNWQDYLAMGVFAVAAMYVAARAYRSLFSRAKAGCGSGCGSCSTKSGATSAPTDLLAIGPSPTKRQAE